MKNLGETMRLIDEHAELHGYKNKVIKSDLDDKSKRKSSFFRSAVKT